jgi:hypothetical protein
MNRLSLYDETGNGDMTRMLEMELFNPVTTTNGVESWRPGRFGTCRQRRRHSWHLDRDATERRSLPMHDGSAQRARRALLDGLIWPS